MSAVPPHTANTFPPFDTQALIVSPAPTQEGNISVTILLRG